MVMPAPSTLLASLRPDIKEAMQQFNLMMNLKRMIALQVFPVIETQEQGGSFPLIKVESLLKLVDTARASGGGYKLTEFDFTDDTFATKENGVTIPIDRRNKAIFHNFQMELATAAFARNIVMTNLERRIAALLFNTGTFTPTSATVAWATLATCVPITDVEAAIQRLYAKGIEANALIISWQTFRNLRNCEQIIERINSQGAGTPSKPEDITVQMLANIFSLPKVIVGGAQYNSAAEGQTASLSGIWSNSYAMVTRVAEPGATFEDPSIGRTFHWAGDGSSIDGTIETYYVEDNRGDRLRYRMETQEKVLYTAAGELIAI